LVVNNTCCFNGDEALDPLERLQELPRK
jgi:hypothetical protein